MKRKFQHNLLLNESGASQIETIIEGTIVLSGISSLIYFGIYKFQWFKWKHVGYTLGILFIVYLLLIGWYYFFLREKTEDDGNRTDHRKTD